MKTAAKSYGESLLKKRAKRLHEMISSADKTPDVIVAAEIMIIMRAGMLYCPDAIGNALVREVRKSVYQSRGYCTECGAHVGEGERGSSCKACTEKAERVQKEFEVAGLG